MTARSTDPLTSHVAVDASGKAYLAQIVLDLCEAHPDGLTTSEMADLSGQSRVSLSPRCRPLVVEGKLTEIGKRKPAGHRVNQIVWALSPKAVEA